MRNKMLLASALLLVGPAGVSALGCVSWRQTGGCDPNGPREVGSDLACQILVRKGNSGYCECTNGRRAAMVGCMHEEFTCEDQCRRLDETCEQDASGACSVPAEQKVAPAAAVPATDSLPGPSQCVGWRNTAQCNPTAARDPGGDRGCSDNVPPGASGFCECMSSRLGRTFQARRSTCDHPEFSCARECARADHYACVGWRQTAGCSADGEREEQNDKPCNFDVPAGVSGYCECGGGRRVPRAPGCNRDEGSARCDDVCGRGETLYEVMGVDEAVSERDLKQARGRRVTAVRPPRFDRRATAPYQVACGRGRGDRDVSGRPGPTGQRPARLPRHM